MKVKKLNSVKVPKVLESYAQAKANNRSTKRKPLLVALSTYDIDDNARKCIESGPKNIRDLKDGLTFDAYEITEQAATSLHLLGFAAINFNKLDKVIVVEYAQTGTHHCDGKRLKFGIGARMVMKIKKNRWGGRAKLDNPYQVTASVIFGKASVQYSIVTFGITGPGTAKLINSGTLAEDTYGKFVSDISSLIVEAYQNEQQFTIVPQPMFL